MIRTHYKISIKYTELLKPLGVFIILLLGLCTPAQADVHQRVQAAFLNFPLSFDIGSCVLKSVWAANLPSVHTTFGFIKAVLPFA